MISSLLALMSLNCYADLNNFKSLCQDIGIPLKADKTIAPTTCLTVYGIEVDSVAMECRLPQEKIDKIVQLLTAYSNCKKITLNEMQSLLGLLNFACLIICPGRTFLRRLYDLTCNISKPHHSIRLSNEARSDLRTWLEFIHNFNGKSVFLNDEWFSSDRLALYTDASGKIGFAAVLGSKWFALRWTPQLAPLQIAIKELFPIVLAIEVWGNLFRNHKVLFFSDNDAVVNIINKQTCKDKQLMVLVRRLVLSALKHNILFRAKHIPGKHNVIADGLSRFQFQTVFKKAPWLDKTQTELPPVLLQI